MKEAIKQFVSVYLNSQNVFLATVLIMTALLILYVVLSLIGFRSIRKIIKALREETGEQIIKKIESLNLSKRYEKMWNDYYEAYCCEDTVALNNYLIKNDMFITKNLFKIASRIVALCGFSVAGIGAIKIPGIFIAEIPNLVCLFFALIIVQGVFEFFYVLFENIRKKRTAKYMEEFKMLCMRKLPGKAAKFELVPIINRIDDLDERLDKVRSGIIQLNARMDRQYDFLENMEKPEE
ncbi:MAG: hypothetical protein E7365_02435 [Clostridiales bacterium]|nr:hypothetical protein [Clostridiales bacterium]